MAKKLKSKKTDPDPDLIKKLKKDLDDGDLKRLKRDVDGAIGDDGDPDAKQLKSKGKKKGESDDDSDDAQKVKKSSKSSSKREKTLGKSEPKKKKKEAPFDVDGDGDVDKDDEVALKQIKRQDADDAESDDAPDTGGKKQLKSKDDPGEKTLADGPPDDDDDGENDVVGVFGRIKGKRSKLPLPLRVDDGDPINDGPVADSGRPADVIDVRPQLKESLFRRLTRVLWR